MVHVWGPSLSGALSAPGRTATGPESRVGYASSCMERMRRAREQVLRYCAAAKPASCDDQPVLRGAGASVVRTGTPSETERDDALVAIGGGEDGEVPRVARRVVRAHRDGLEWSADRNESTAARNEVLPCEGAPDGSRKHIQPRWPRWEQGPSPVLAVRQHHSASGCSDETCRTWRCASGRIKQRP
jgi:hypothetical protein